MHNKRSILLILFALSYAANTCSESINSIPLKASIKKAISAGKIYSKSTVRTHKIKGKKVEQELSFQIAARHNKDCKTALRRLSRYEVYKKHISFIKESGYNEELNSVHFKLSSLLLPYDMNLSFKIPRISHPGSYPFTFETGFLKGLKGNIKIIEYKKRCFFYTNAHWRGKYTGIPATILEIFSSTLSKLAMRNMLRISRY